MTKSKIIMDSIRDCVKVSKLGSNWTKYMDSLPGCLNEAYSVFPDRKRNDACDFLRDQAARSLAELRLKCVRDTEFREKMTLPKPMSTSPKESNEVLERALLPRTGRSTDLIEHKFIEKDRCSIEYYSSYDVFPEKVKDIQDCLDTYYVKRDPVLDPVPPFNNTAQIGGEGVSSSQFMCFSFENNLVEIGLFISSGFCLAGLFLVIIWTILKKKHK